MEKAIVYQSLTNIGHKKNENFFNIHVFPFLPGGLPVKSLLTNVPENCFGWLDNVDHVIEHGRSYVLLSREATPVSTLVLCHQEEEMLDEFKVLTIRMFLAYHTS